MRYARRRAALEAGRHNAVARRRWERTRAASPFLSLVHAINTLLIFAAVLFFAGFFLFLISPVAFAWVAGCCALAVALISAPIIARRIEAKRKRLASSAAIVHAPSSAPSESLEIECPGPVPRTPCPRRAQVLRAVGICDYCHWLKTGERDSLTPR